MEKRLSESFYFWERQLFWFPKSYFQCPLSWCQLTALGYWPWNEVVGLGRIQRPQWPRRGGMLGTGKLPFHDDVIIWINFPRYWPFMRGIHRSTVNSPHRGQWRGALIFSLICVWINGWVSRGWWFETLSRPLWRHRNVHSTNVEDDN